MGKIALLDKLTIDQIAAGEVIERPASVVKELVENAIDAHASAITVDIKDGGISSIRISDNGSGIDREDIPLAFLRHSTSKIHCAKDLQTIQSLGFRGEALSSIAAVSMVELLTKRPEDFTGYLYRIEGGNEISGEEAPAVEGTTFTVENLFFNTPARKKFLKSSMTEAGYIYDVMIHLSLSHPEISFMFVSDGRVRIHTSGNHNVKDAIYQVYGREVALNLYELHKEQPREALTIDGYIGQPNVSRGNRNYETFYVNGRYVKNSMISKALEDAYKGNLMQHRYPFAILNITLPCELLDVNVHPSKMEIRFSKSQQMYDFVFSSVKQRLTAQENIPNVEIAKPEPDIQEVIKEPIPLRLPEEKDTPEDIDKYNLEYFLEKMKERVKADYEVHPDNSPYEKKFPIQKDIAEAKPSYEQMELFSQTPKKLLDQNSMKEHRIIGQIFDTYWLVEFDNRLFIIDQHAAHEKVLYERLMKKLRNKEITSQIISPTIVLHLTMQEEELLKENMELFTSLGFEISHFGGLDYQLCGVADNLFSINKKELFMEILDGLGEISGGKAMKSTPDILLDRMASMACKAAVKGNNKLSRQEAEELIAELLTLDNPYHCPHGRPTIISMTKQELEKKFGRII